MKRIATVAAGTMMSLALVAAPPVAFGAGAPAANPATPHEVGGAKGWTGYSYLDRGNKVCYLVGHPSKTEPARAARGRIDAMVTERPHEKQLNVVNFDAGYAFKEGSSATIEIDGHGFSLFTDHETAWARDAATDGAVTEALARGRRAVLKGTNAKGAAVTQSYSLEGFGDALAAIDKACGMKR